MRGLSGEPKNVPPAEMTFSLAAEGLHVQPFVERDRLVRTLLLDRQPQRRGDAAHVDVVEVLHRGARKKPQQDGARDRVDVRQLLRLAAVSDVQAVHLRRRELRQQSAELLAQGQVRLDLFVGLRVEVRQVDGVAHFAGEQIARDDLGDFDAAFLLRLAACWRPGAA